MTPLGGYTFSVLVSLVSLNASLPTLRVDFLLVYFFNAASFVGEVSRTKQVFLLLFLDAIKASRLHVGHSITRSASQDFIILKT